MTDYWFKKSVYKTPEAQGFVNTSDFTSVSTNLATITGLSIPVDVNERWMFVCDMVVQNDSTANGVKFGINGPTSATVQAYILGIGTGVTNNRNDVVTALHTQSNNYAAVATTPGGVRIAGSMLVSSTSGNLTIEGKITTDGTLRVYVGAYIRAWRFV